LEDLHEKTRAEMVQAAAELLRYRDIDREQCADCMRCDLYKEFVWGVAVSLTIPNWPHILHFFLLHIIFKNNLVLVTLNHIITYNVVISVLFTGFGFILQKAIADAIVRLRKSAQKL